LKGRFLLKMDIEKIPEKLRNIDFRFYLIAKNGKTPIEKKWNKSDGNNYGFRFCNDAILKHNGNLGICTGFGNLIVFDFDDWKFYEKIRFSLPHTFTVKTALKRQYHMYFIYQGQMFGKIPINDKEGNRVCDIQGMGAGVVCPGSSIDGRYYEVQYDYPIAIMPSELLNSLFPNIKVKQFKEFDSSNIVSSPELMQKAIDVLVKLGIKRTRQSHFKCPFHEMHATGNLYVFPDGAIRCFHEQKSWKNIDSFLKYYNWKQNLRRD
jgi:hypothetical protein